MLTPQVHLWMKSYAYNASLPFLNASQQLGSKKAGSQCWLQHVQQQTQSVISILSIFSSSSTSFLRCPQSSQLFRHFWLFRLFRHNICISAQFQRIPMCLEKATYMRFIPSPNVSKTLPLRQFPHLSDHGPPSSFQWRCQAGHFTCIQLTETWLNKFFMTHLVQNQDTIYKPETTSIYWFTVRIHTHTHAYIYIFHSPFIFQKHSTQEPALSVSGNK